MRPLPPHDQTNGHAEFPFMDLATFNRVYLHLVANGDEARADDFVQRFHISQDGAFPKIQIHVGEDTTTEKTT